MKEGDRVCLLRNQHDLPELRAGSQGEVLWVGANLTDVLFDWGHDDIWTVPNRDLAVVVYGKYPPKPPFVERAIAAALLVAEKQHGCFSEAVFKEAIEVGKSVAEDPED